MEAPRVDNRREHHIKDRISYLQSRPYELEVQENKTKLYIPTSFKNTNDTELISIDKYLIVLKYLVVNSNLECDSKRGIIRISNIVNGKVAAAIASAVAYVDRGAAAASRSASSSSTYINVDPGFGEHVNNLRGTMFYVCQGSCLCGTVNNRGKVIYCYGDLVPRHGELFAEGADGSGSTTSKDLLAAQLGIWTFGIIAL